MDIRVKWFDKQFNVNLAASADAEEFLSIKGCRIVDGKNGPFVSWPSSKKASGEGYWNHVWANEKFAAAVLAKAQAGAPNGKPKSGGSSFVPAEEDIPFVSADVASDIESKVTRRMRRYG